MEKLDKSYIFVYFPTHFLFKFIINTVTRGAHDICTCVLWEFLTLTYVRIIDVKHICIKIFIDN